MRERRARPQYDAIALLALLEKRGLPQTAAHLRDVVALIWLAWQERADLALRHLARVEGITSAPVRSLSR